MADRQSSGWNTALFIARKDVAHAMRTRVTVIWLFLMPIVFMFFIGTTTSRMGSVDAAVTLAVERGGTSGFLADHLVHRLQDRDFVIATGEDAPPRLLRVPDGFTRNVLSGKPVTLTYAYEPGKLSTSYDLLKVKRAAYTVLADVVVSDAGNAEDGAAAIARLDAVPRPVTLSVTTAGQRLEVPGGFEQAVPGMLVMFTMIVLLTSGAIDLLVDRQRGVLRRLASVPVARGWLVLGKWGGKMTLALVQIAFALLVGTVLFGMQWGPNLPMVFGVLLAWAAFCASFAFLLGSVGRTEAQIMGLGLGVTLLMAALGGCWWPIEIAPPAFQSLQMVLPSGWAMDAMHRLISFQAAPTDALPHVAALLGAAAFIGWVGKRRLRFA